MTLLCNLYTEISRDPEQHTCDTTPSAVIMQDPDWEEQKFMFRESNNDIVHIPMSM